MQFKIQVTDTLTNDLGIDVVNPVIVMGVSTRQKDASNYVVGLKFTYYKDEAAFDNGSSDLSILLPDTVPTSHSMEYDQVAFDALNLDANGTFSQLMTDAVAFLGGHFAAVATI